MSNQPNRNPLARPRYRFARHLRIPIGTLLVFSSAASVPDGELLTALCRHARGDCGTFDDWTANEAALAVGGRVRSIFELSDGSVIEVHTDLARGVTMVGSALEWA